MTDEPPEEPPDFREQRFERTEEYERVLTALLNPRGRRISEIADTERADPGVVRRIVSNFVSANRLVLDSDGERSDPRVYRNLAMDTFAKVWREFAFAADEAELELTAKSLEEEIETYVDETGYVNSEEFREAIGEADLSHVDAADTGELFIDVYRPWALSEYRLSIVRLALDTYEFLSEVTEAADADVDGVYGDFDDINAIESKVGLDDEPPTGSLREDGTYEPDDEPPRPI